LANEDGSETPLLALRLAVPERLEIDDPRVLNAVVSYESGSVLVPAIVESPGQTRRAKMTLRRKRLILRMIRSMSFGTTRLYRYGQNYYQIAYWSLN
jgi:hypothetical protein